MATNPETARGLPSLLYTCSYAPEEIILAAGFVPRRIIPERPSSEADAYMHPNTCYYLKSLLASAIAGDASKAKGIVFTNSCDGMRRLYDLWSEYVKDVPTLFVDVPKKKDPSAIEFFASELRSLAERIEKELGGSKVTDERVNETIGERNNVRRLMDKVFKLQRDTGSGVGGLSIFDLCIEGATSHPAEFAEKIRAFLADSREENVPAERPTVVLTGNIIYRPDLIALIAESGARVGALDTCVGVRHYDTLVKVNSPDPMLALAERYLLKAPCARMQGIEDRFRLLEELADGCRADGVIYSTVKFCDAFLYDAPSMRERFEHSGIPFLFLENDYEWGGLEQMKTRVEAFIAMLGERGSN